MTIDQIAQVCFEVNRAYCQALGDHSFLSWKESPEWQRSTCIKGVVFHIDHPDAGTSDSHDSWLAEKRREGWVYGPVKDADLKQHPCFVPYEELPTEQKAKDFLFRQVVHSLKAYWE